jgi:hypothetical protein
MARSRADYTVLQAMPQVDPKIEVVIAGTYNDVFKREVGQWRFRQRRGDVHLIGNLQHHLREEPLKQLVSQYAARFTA